MKHSDDDSEVGYDNDDDDDNDDDTDDVVKRSKLTMTLLKVCKWQEYEQMSKKKRPRRKKWERKATGGLHDLKVHGKKTRLKPGVRKAYREKTPKKIVCHEPTRVPEQYFYKVRKEEPEGKWRRVGIVYQDKPPQSTTKLDQDTATAMLTARLLSLSPNLKSTSEVETWVDVRRIVERYDTIQDVERVVRRLIRFDQFHLLLLSRADIYVELPKPPKVVHRHLAVTRRWTDMDKEGEEGSQEKAQKRVKPKTSKSYRTSQGLTLRIYGRDEEGRKNPRGPLTRIERSLHTKNSRTVLGLDHPPLVADLARLVMPDFNVFEGLRWFTFREDEPRKMKHLDSFIVHRRDVGELGMQRVYDTMATKRIRTTSWLVEDEEFATRLQRIYQGTLRRFLGDFME